MKRLRGKRSDSQLVRKLKARDPRAFETLVRRFEGPVMNLLYRMIGVRAEAEDLAQEVFVSVFKKIDTFRQDSSLSTWVFRIASNHCKNRLKYLGRRGAGQSVEMDEDRLVNPGGAMGAPGFDAISRPDELVEGFQMERLIQQAIFELDADHRLILILRDIQNLTYDEITGITGLPLGTVKSRLHRARMALKEKMAAYLR